MPQGEKKSTSQHFVISIICVTSSKGLSPWQSFSQNTDRTLTGAAIHDLGPKNHYKGKIQVFRIKLGLLDLFNVAILKYPLVITHLLSKVHTGSHLIINLGLGGKIGTFLDHFGTLVPFGTMS